VQRARFFPEEAPELRHTLEQYLSALGERLRAQLFFGEVTWLFLAGGYGRGEGGIFQGPDQAPALYNDLEFYLVLKSRRAWKDAAQWAAREAHLGEEATGIEVEFKLLTVEALRTAAPSMFYYDLLSAHILVAGNEKSVADLPDILRDGTMIPAQEATRLLFNRGTGLWYCRQALRAGSEKLADGFIERNHAKMRLALADAVLALNGRYHFSAAVRHARLTEPLAHLPPAWPQLVSWHAQALEFKLRPRHEHPGQAVLAQKQAELVGAWTETFLWLESLRLGKQFAAVPDYSGYRGRLFPASPIWRNALLHARDRWRRGLRLAGWIDYPRAVLQRVLLLQLGAAVPEGSVRREVPPLLGMPAGVNEDSVCAAYRRAWQHYN
jgi:hypothetical protein